MSSNVDERLRLYIERVERLNEEVAGLQADKRDVYAEMKAVGYDTKIAKKIVAMRKLDPEKRKEEDMITDTYKTALGLD